MSRSAKLSPVQLEALRIGASRRSRLVSFGDDTDRFPTAPSTLRSLRKRGLVEFKGARGYYYGAVDSQTQYRITEAGREALFLAGVWTVTA